MAQQQLAEFHFWERRRRTARGEAAAGNAARRAARLSLTGKEARVAAKFLVERVPVLQRELWSKGQRADAACANSAQQSALELVGGNRAAVVSVDGVENLVAHRGE